MTIKDPRAKEFTAGLLASMISISLTYPITKLIYRQIIDKTAINSSVSKLGREGLRQMYRGILPPLFQRSTEISIMFGIYKTASLALKPLNLSETDELLASSVITGFAESILTPFERTQILLIDSKYNERFRNTGHAFYLQLTHYGVKELYRGYVPILWRNISHNLFFFSCKERLHDLISSHSNLQNDLKNFIVGALVGLMMTGLFYPLKVIKTEMQMPLGGKFHSMFSNCKKIYYYQQLGITNFYRGANLNIIRAIFSWGVTNLSYEFIKDRI